MGTIGRDYISYVLFLHMLFGHCELLWLGLLHLLHFIIIIKYTWNHAGCLLLFCGCFMIQGTKNFMPMCVTFCVKYVGEENV